MKLERCAGGWQCVIPLLYGRGGVAVRRRTRPTNVFVVLVLSNAAVGAGEVPKS